MMGEVFVHSACGASSGAGHMENQTDVATRFPRLQLSAMDHPLSLRYVCGHNQNRPARTWFDARRHPCVDLPSRGIDWPHANYVGLCGLICRCLLPAACQMAQHYLIIL